MGSSRRPSARACTSPSLHTAGTSVLLNSSFPNLVGLGSVSTMGSCSTSTGVRGPLGLACAWPRDSSCRVLRAGGAALSSSLCTLGDTDLAVSAVFYFGVCFSPPFPSSRGQSLLQDLLSLMLKHEQLPFLFFTVIFSHGIRPPSNILSCSSLPWSWHWDKTAVSVSTRAITAGLDLL